MLPNAKQSLFSSGYPTNVKTRPATYNSQILDDYYRGERYGDRYGSSLDYQINKPPAQVSREYIPIEKKEIEYVPQQKIEYFPVERDYVDYLEIEHQRDYIPIPKLNRYTDYVPVERYDQTIDYLPYDKSQVKGYNGSSRANGSYGNYSGRGYPNEFRQRSAYGNYQGYSGYQGYGGGISGYPVNPSYGNPYLGLGIKHIKLNMNFFLFRI